MKRPSHDEYFMAMANLASLRSTCVRRKVGCILVNQHFHVIATGYNGVAAGLTHCIDRPCAGASHPSGQGLDLCEAIHAEQNALLQCKDTQSIYATYCTSSPCITCVKLFLNTSCRYIYFNKDYPHKDAERLWKSKRGNTWLHMSLPTEWSYDKVSGVSAYAS